MALKDFFTKIKSCVSPMQDDAIAEGISQKGYIYEPRLWRRFVMAQMFRWLHRNGQDLTPSEENYDACIKPRHFPYAWSVLKKDLKAQRWAQVHDPEQFRERNRWFNLAVVRSMACELEKQGVTTNIPDQATPSELYEAVARIKRIPAKGSKGEVWYDAFKGSGAFATMKNLILFHNCRWHLDDGTILDAESSFEALKELNYNPATTGRQMFGAMLKLIVDNRFNWKQF